MSSERTNILICGVSRSGSHALVDLFSEYDNIGIYPGEFDYFRAPGMVADQLDDKLRVDWPSLIGKTIYPRNFKSKIAHWFFSASPLQYLNRLKQIERIKAIQRRIQSARIRKELMNLELILQSQVSHENKIYATKKWIQSIGNLYCHDDPSYNYFLFDQPLTLSTDVETVKKVFSPFKMICCLRDPRDQLANLVKDGYLFLPYDAPRMNWGGDMLQALYGRTRAGAFKMYVEDIRTKYQRTKFLKESLGPDRFKVISFESLVKNYSNTIADLENFLGLRSKHHTEIRKKFDPEKSVINIGYHKKYLKTDEYDLLVDLEKQYHDWFPNTTVNR